MTNRDLERQNWLNEPYETRNRSTSCRTSGKNVAYNRNQFYSEWAEYVSLWDQYGNMDRG